ncbi:MAG: hypothetical protein E6G41_11270 [Actinobacteria bacterium]|nr:MAG: hypothetical protein E6G41_11270 [Actinomycetota bacterium]
MPPGVAPSGRSKGRRADIDALLTRTAHPLSPGRGDARSSGRRGRSCSRPSHKELSHGRPDKRHAGPRPAQPDDRGLHAVRRTRRAVADARARRGARRGRRTTGVLPREPRRCRIRRRRPRGQLERLHDIGITGIELMPIAAFPGERGWGYDGVYPWSAQAPYGGPDGLQRLVDAAHAHGIAVVLDIVPNHVGASPGPSPGTARRAARPAARPCR